MPRGQAMVPAPPATPPIGAFSQQGPPVQDVVGAVVRELRTSMLDVGTAVRLGWRGRRVYFGTGTEPPQQFAAPVQTNSPDSVNAGVAQAGNAPRALNKTASRGSKASSLPRPLGGPIR
jgi:hypothetical protein